MENTDNHERNEAYELKREILSLKFIKMFPVFEIGLNMWQFFFPLFFILFRLFIYREMDNIDDPARISIFIALFYWGRGGEKERKSNVIDVLGSGRSVSDQ